MRPKVTSSVRRIPKLHTSDLMENLRGGDDDHGDEDASDNGSVDGRDGGGVDHEDDHDDIDEDGEDDDDDIRESDLL